MIKKFRKKPVVIEAVFFNGTSESIEEISQWMGEQYAGSACDSENPNRSYLHIHTLEGRMTASPGDMIIKGVNGEFYPCKPDIFQKTYDTL